MDTYIPEFLQTLLPKPLLQECRSKPFHKGDYLFEQGKVPEWMFYVVAGEVALSRLSNHGDTTILQRCKTGFVSEASLLADVYHCDAVVTQSGTCLSVPTNTLREALTDNTFSLKWIQLLSREIMRLRTQAERLGLKDIKSKLIHLIETEGRQGTLTIKSDFKSLAAEIGVTHEALYRTIATLEAKGVLQKKAGLLHLLKR